MLQLSHAYNIFIIESIDSVTKVFKLWTFIIMNLNQFHNYEP